MTVHDHGSLSTYINHRCRCAPCRAANTENTRLGRRRRQEAMDQGRVSPPHGKYSTYKNYGCRCELCRAANALAARRRYNQRAKVS